MLSQRRTKALERELWQRAMDGDSRTGLTLLKLQQPDPAQLAISAAGGVVELPAIIDEDDE